MEVFQQHTGQIPLVISVPHAGTEVPSDILATMTTAARQLPDTDWFLPRLYQLQQRRDVHWIAANVSRYVIDLNRPTSDENLYPGQNTTGLCPETNFDGSPVYQSSANVGAAERERRIATYWKPYHDRLGKILADVVAQHGIAVLLDAHSILSQVPNLFAGVLPDLNFGTNHGRSCGSTFQEFVERFAKEIGASGRHSTVVNGRFVGGFITRNYGAPNNNVHAVQLEIAQCNYMDEATGQWHDERATLLQKTLDQFITAITSWIESQ